MRLTRVSKRFNSSRKNTLIEKCKSKTRKTNFATSHVCVAVVIYTAGPLMWSRSFFLSSQALDDRGHRNLTTSTHHASAQPAPQNKRRLQALQHWGPKCRRPSSAPPQTCLPLPPQPCLPLPPQPLPATAPARPCSSAPASHYRHEHQHPATRAPYHE